MKIRGMVPYPGDEQSIVGMSRYMASRQQVLSVGLDLYRAMCRMRELPGSWPHRFVRKHFSVPVTFSREPFFTRKDELTITGLHPHALSPQIPRRRREYSRRCAGALPEMPAQARAR